MGRVSKRIVSKEFQEQLEEQLSFIVLSLNNKSEISVFLGAFLTKEEKIMLGKRLILYMLLSKGWTSSKIHDTLSMSYETIRWYKQIFENKPNVFKKTVQKLIVREKGKEFWRKLEKLLEPAGLVLEAKHNMKARAKLAGGDFWQS